MVSPTDKDTSGTMVKMRSTETQNNLNAYHSKSLPGPGLGVHTLGWSIYTAHRSSYSSSKTMCTVSRRGSSAEHLSNSSKRLPVCPARLITKAADTMNYIVHCSAMKPNHRDPGSQPRNRKRSAGSYSGESSSLLPHSIDTTMLPLPQRLV